MGIIRRLHRENKRLKKLLGTHSALLIKVGVLFDKDAIIERLEKQLSDIKEYAYNQAIFYEQHSMDCGIPAKTVVQKFYRLVAKLD